MSEIATYCEICRIYHAPRPRDRCEAHVRRDRSGAGRPLSAIGMSIVLAIGAGWAAGTATNDGATALGAAVGTAAAVLLFHWIRSRAPRPPR
ncbi:MAG: hypothetical protein AB7S26_43060 [Sandaracinaceae bacterium]